MFNDPRLTRLIQLAYQQNLTLRTAGVRVLEARARLGIAIGEFYPQQQQLGASLTYNRIPISLPYNFVTNTYWADQFGAQAAWELDIWGKLRRAIESADGGFWLPSLVTMMCSLPWSAMWQPLTCRSAPPKDRSPSPGTTSRVNKRR